MANTPLSPTTVKKVQCPQDKDKIRLHDAKCPGLALEVRRTGTKTYFLRYTNAYGNQCQMKLGRANELSLAQARKLAKKHLAEIALGGADPLESKRLLRTVPTLSEFAHGSTCPT